MLRSREVNAGGKGGVQEECRRGRRGIRTRDETDPTILITVDVGLVRHGAQI